MAKVVLTGRFVASPKRVPTTGRAEYNDAIVPGLALRVTATGHRSYVLVARYPASRPVDPDKPWNPTRRALGDYRTISLDTARETARKWLALIQRGIDPKVEETRNRAEERRRQINVFSHVAREFIARAVKGPARMGLEEKARERLKHDVFTDKVSAEKAFKKAFAAVCADPQNRALVEAMRRQGIVKVDEAVRAIEGDYVKRWGPRSINDILPEECAIAIRAIAERAPYEAHNRLGHLRRLFNWAVSSGEFGITVSPVERLSPKDLIGKREARDRILNDEELRAVWAAAGEMGYPYGPLFRLLILTGQREREVAEVVWSEIDVGQAMWTIPATRMKAVRAHEVPLAPMALRTLRALPEWTQGPHLFTTTAGTKPVNGFSVAKKRIDKLSGVERWKIHDLRRTVRTHFSALPIQDNVRELVIAHARPGLHKVYDLHAYQAEKRECLELWEKRLAGILASLPSMDVPS